MVEHGGVVIDFPRFQGAQLTVEVVIRPFRPADVEGLFVLDYRCYKPPYRFGYSQLMHTISDAGVTVVVIDDEAAQELIGGMILRTDVNAREAVVVSLMVEREHRRIGLGTRLLQRAQEFVRTSGWTRVAVPLERGNEAGEALLRAGGCRDSGVYLPFYTSPDAGSVWQWVPEAAAEGVMPGEAGAMPAAGDGKGSA